MRNRQQIVLYSHYVLFCFLLLILSCDRQTEKSISEKKITKIEIKEKRNKDQSGLDSIVSINRGEFSEDEALLVFKKRKYEYKNRQEFKKLLEQANTLRKISNGDIQKGVTTPPIAIKTTVLPGTNISSLTEDAYGDLLGKENIHNFQVHNFLMNFCMYLNHIDHLRNISIGSELNIRNIAAMKLKINTSSESLAGHILQGTVNLVSATRYLLVVENKQNSTTNFQILKGRVFDELDYDNRVQSMTVSRSIDVKLNSQEIRKIDIEMYCLEKRKPAPGNSSLVMTPFVVDFNFFDQQDIWYVYENM